MLEQSLQRWMKWKFSFARYNIIRYYIIIEMQ